MNLKNHHEKKILKFFLQCAIQCSWKLEVKDEGITDGLLRSFFKSKL